MSSRARTLLLAVLALTGVGALALGVLAVRDLHAVAATLSDPAPVIEQVVDQYLAAVPSQNSLRADDPLLGERKIFVTANINEYTAKDVAARLLYLNGRDARRPIDLYLSTQGGWVDSAFTIIDVMNLIDAPVNTWAIGGCYSAGALILAAGTGTRFATSNAMLMIHASLDEDSEQSFSYERLALERYERIWRERAALPDDWFPMVGGEEYYLSPDEALRFKLIDAIVPAGDPTHTVHLEGSPP
ncbi:MAG: ATP-dependent Clp protease proteolytic subunit [Candidatus Binatia bacterium]